MIATHDGGWRDMLVVGTAVNLVAVFATLMAAASHAAPPWLPLALHFSPLPLNLFLVAAIGRARPRHPAATAAALAWFAVMTLV